MGRRANLSGPGTARNRRPLSTYSIPSLPLRPRGRPSLLHVLQDLLERTYRIDSGVGEISRFVIGDEGYRLLYGRTGAAVRRTADAMAAGTASWGSPAGARLLVREGVGPIAAGTARGFAEAGARFLVRGGVGPIAAGTASTGSAAGARVLVRDGSGSVAACIYYPDALIAHLERFPPGQGIGDENIDAFAAFVEELDHFLVLAERVRLGRPVSLLELELHANVTKYLVCALFLARAAGRGDRSGSLDASARAWLLWHLFEKVTFAEPEPQVQERYCDASRFGRRVIDRLEREKDRVTRLALLRAFHDAGGQDKLTLLG